MFRACLRVRRTVVRSKTRSGSHLAIADTRSMVHTSTPRSIQHGSDRVSSSARRQSCLCHKRLASTSAALRPQDDRSEFMRSHSGDYLDGLYLQWKRSPFSVHPSWREYFDEMQNEKASKLGEIPEVAESSTSTEDDSIVSDPADLAKVQLLVRAYQASGHLKADIDPLGIQGLVPSIPAELTIGFYGFSDADLDRGFPLGPALLPRFAPDTPSMTLRNIVATCEKLYCSTYAVEYLHIADREKCDWIRDRLEVPDPISYSVDEKSHILDRLTWSATFEQFMAAKHPNKKRYGLEGCEGFTPGFKALVDQAAEEHGVENIVVGMQHRGRMSIMSNVTRKPNKALFYEFSARARASQTGQAGDVHNHLGWDHTRVTPKGGQVYLSILANPSHLEADDPVAAGKAKAIQHFGNDFDKKKTMCLTVHGDAAISGQGVVYETFGLNKLSGYSVGGTVHILVNNQIGFTTDPKHSRSTPYCSDIAKAFDAPVFHVNGDDVEAVYFFCQLAADWRATFQTDCVVDIVCYRKFGHNEMDQPMFTQPFMYDRIAHQVPVYDRYVAKLVGESTFSHREISESQAKIWAQMEKSFEESKIYEPDGSEEIISPAWKCQKTTAQLREEVLPVKSTAVDRESINKIRDKYAAIPSNFVLHRNTQKVLDSRIKAMDSGDSIDWSTAEALAFGTLCMEGHHVRISGQDVQRGTFSQRHAVLHNQRTDSSTQQTDGSTWSPLDSLTHDQGSFSAVNSPLGEFGVLGFEYGYSLASPQSLVMWEAQFGDFANNAQCIIDNFLASGETKWLQRSGLVLSLPHGYDGQGPEHSSARIERFLQLCNEDPRRFPENIDQIHQACNMQVVYMTTPANLFHVLRRQIHRDFRKPLIIFFSKSLLRHPKTKSHVNDLMSTSKFEHIIPDSCHETGAINSPHAIKRVILCTGQVYAALEEHRAKNKIKDVAITRIEQLHPFPWAQIRDNLDRYSNAQEVIWCQEEPMNGGAWLHVQARINTNLKNTKHHKKKMVEYVGRDPGASTATAFRRTHIEEEEKLVKEAFAQSSN